MDNPVTVMLLWALVFKALVETTLVHIFTKMLDLDVRIQWS